jgi:hypothetical protein
MYAHELVIQARKRQDPIGIVDPSDFEFSEGASFDPQIVITNPLISFYCLDHANRRGLFIETAPGVNLCDAPFMYQAQYENALRLFAVDYATLHKLASQVALDGSQIIFVHSVGRSGSTLVDAALSAIDGVVAFSEPDVFSQLVLLRDWEGGNTAEVSALTQTCVKLICKPTGQIPNPGRWVIKFRSFCIELGDFLYAHFPAATNIFLYRNLNGYLVSAMRAFADLSAENDPNFRMMAQTIFSATTPTIYRHAKNNGPLLTLIGIGTMMWLRTLECYMELTASGMPGMAVRYEDIKAAPHETALKIIEYCGLPTVDLSAVDKALERDSQAGSALSQEKLQQKSFSLTDAHKADVAQILQAQPVIRSADFVVPTTWIRE